MSGRHVQGCEMWRYAGCWSEHDVSRGSCVVRGWWVTPSPVTAPHSSCRHATAEETQCRRGRGGEWVVTVVQMWTEICDCEVRLWPVGAVGGWIYWDWDCIRSRLHIEMLARCSVSADSYIILRGFSLQSIYQNLNFQLFKLISILCALLTSWPLTNIFVGGEDC